MPSGHRAAFEWSSNGLRVAIERPSSGHRAVDHRRTADRRRMVLRRRAAVRRSPTRTDKCLTLISYSPLTISCLISFKYSVKQYGYRARRESYCRLIKDKQIMLEALVVNHFAV